MLPQAAPREGGKPRPIHWTYTELPHGVSEVGYLGAKTQWIWLHSARQSKPCIHELTQGEIECPYCPTMRMAEVKGFVAMYRAADWKPIAFWVNEEMRDVLDALPFAARIERSRARTKGSPIAVRRMLDPNPVFESSLPERKTWSDTTLSLVKLLKCPVLEAYARERLGLQVGAKGGRAAGDQGGAAAVRDGDAPPAVPEGDPYLLGSSWLGRLPKDQQAEILARRNRAFIESAKRPGANGNHKGGE